MKSTHCVGFLVMVLFVFGVLPIFRAGYARGGNLVQDESFITIKGKNRTLEVLLPEIAAQSGYTIEIGESLLTQKIRGEYVKSPITNFFKRIFKRMNVFQVIDLNNKTIKILAIDRDDERIFVMKTNNENETNSTSRYWRGNTLDGEPSRTNEDLLSPMEEAGRGDDFSSHELDGEPGRTMQDLLDERTEVYEQYDVNDIELDGEPDRTFRDLLQERDELAANYNSAQQPLDGEPGKTTQDLLDERTGQGKKINSNNLPLDGEPDRTFQDLLDERERVFGVKSGMISN